MPPARGSHDGAFSPAYGCLCGWLAVRVVLQVGTVQRWTSLHPLDSAMIVATTLPPSPCAHVRVPTPLPPLPCRTSPVCVCVSVYQLLWRLGARAMASTAHALAVAPALVHPSTCALVTTASTVGHVNSVRFVVGCRTDLVEERGWADAGVVCVWWVASVDCPSHTAWADLATADDTAHAYAPCSNRVRSLVLAQPPPLLSLTCGCGCVCVCVCGCGCVAV